MVPRRARKGRRKRKQQRKRKGGGAQRGSGSPPGSGALGERLQGGGGPPNTRHWKTLVSLPPREMRCPSSWVKRTLVTWLPWPPYTWLGACGDRERERAHVSGPDPLHKHVPAPGGSLHTYALPLHACTPCKHPPSHGFSPIHPTLALPAHPTRGVWLPPPPPAHLGASAGVLEEMNFAEVVCHGHHTFMVGPAQGVDVGAVRAVGPDACKGHWCGEEGGGGQGYLRDPHDSPPAPPHSPKTWKPSTQV